MIYIAGDAAVRARQLGACLASAEALGAVVVATAQDPPGRRDGWVSAQQMIATGQADRILIAEPGAVPDWLLMSSDASPLRRPRRVGTHLSTLHR